MNSLEKEETVINRFEEKDDIKDPKLRNLLSFSDFNTDKTFDIKSFNVCGCTIKIQVRLGVSGGKVFGEIIISANHGSVRFGTNGISGSYSRTWSGDLTIFSFKLPPMPVISLDLIAGGSVTVSASFSSASKTLTVSIGGTLYAKVEIKAGWDQVASVSAGVKGTIVSAQISGSINTSKQITKSGTLSAGTVTVYVDGKLINLTIFHHDWVVFNGWSKSF